VSGESHDEPGGAVVHFAPSSGRVMGSLCVLLAAGVVVVGLVRPGEVVVPVMLGAAAAGVLSWAALLRPRVSVDARTLYLRNMLETVEVPLAAVDEIVVRQVLAVRAGEKRYVTQAIGRKLRRMVKGPRPAPLFMPLPDLPEADDTDAASPRSRTEVVVDYADHVESTLRGLVEDARAREGVTRYSDESLALAAGVRRRPAWVEIGALVVLVAAFVVSLVV
jgi:hypothetical protein